jgi:hypothetical protein
MTPDNLVDPNSPEVTPPVDQNQNLSTENQPSSNLSVDTTGRELFFAAIREKNEEIARLKKEAEQRTTTPKSSEENWGEFTQNPRDLIRSEVADAVKPLNDFIQKLQTGNAFSGLKDQARQNPQWAKVLDKAGGYVDQALNGAAPTLDNVIAAINLVAGAIAMGNIKGLSIDDLRDSPTPTPKVTPTPKTVPPNIQPSSSPLSRPSADNGAKPWENLTETELAMCRVYRMTPEEFWKQSQGDMITVDPTKGGGKK